MPFEAHAAPSPRTHAGGYRVLAKSFERSLLATNRSPATIRISTISAQQFGDFLADRGMPLVVAPHHPRARRGAPQQPAQKSKPPTAETRYRGL